MNNPDHGHSRINKVPLRAVVGYACYFVSLFKTHFKQTKCEPAGKAKVIQCGVFDPFPVAFGGKNI